MKLSDFIIRNPDIQTVFEIVEDFKTQKRYNQIRRRKIIVGTILTLFSVLNYSIHGLFILNISLNFFPITKEILFNYFPADNWGKNIVKKNKHPQPSV